jgi:hypothetical protein
MGGRKTVAIVKAALVLTSLAPAQASAASSGNEVCSGCHASIYDSYRKTIMANASGPADEGLITGEFDHKKSGVSYRVYREEGRDWMNYARKGEPAFQGRRELLYYIGSGLKGRSYLFSVEGFLFETPINWYSQEQRWNMAPAYTEARESPLNLPSYVDCLNCHTSSLQPPVRGTDALYLGKPFLHGGITCERCHGLGNGHLDRRGPIVNPAKLPPDRRDSICMECHFEGTTSVDQPGKHLYDFQPGEALSEYTRYFLLKGNVDGSKGLSQFEALSLSACKRKSGDSMWCGSCHDPHSDPPASEKVAFYRAKCVNCHGAAFAAKHHPDKQDCAECHMPSLPSKDVAHTQTADHRILRVPETRTPAVKTAGPRIEVFPDRDAPHATVRDLALAWTEIAHRGIEGAAAESERYLRQAVTALPDDVEILSALGLLEQKHGREPEARALYEHALQIDPLNNTVATNLGTIEARAGHLKRAVELWNGAFQRAPQRSAIGINMAIVFCTAGKPQEARGYIQRVLDFNPDSTTAKRLMAHLKADPPVCKP